MMRKIVALSAVVKAVSLVAVSAAALPAQTAPMTLLKVDVENVVLYADDVGDPAKRATSQAIVPWPSAQGFTFKAIAGVGDIVAINGKPARGNLVTRHLMYVFTPTYRPGRMIADFAGGGVTDMNFVVQGPDGTPVGNIISSGFCGVAPPPGSPSDATSANMAIAGGTGAYLGARGQVARSQSIAARFASMLEDPANRRTHPGGGKWVSYIHLIPNTWPEVLSLPTGPAIFHGGDFSPVTADKPAQAGETLIMSVSGLGPVRPNLDPGKPFPPFEEGKLHEVNSPVDVTVNGREA
ncbi:MAG: hypothetical protein IT158_13165, partial [Bryobacterales bacterium]|nr:hypothetical protein [Bryobacterales bacterium]